VSLQELQIYGLWAGWQTAKGTPLAAPLHRFKQVAGGFQMPREDGSENFSDATGYTGTTDWVNTLVGQGTPGVEGTPEESAWLAATLEGGETVTAVTGPPAKSKHAITPLPGLGRWTTWYERLGSQVLTRRRHNDAQISQLQIEGSTGAKAIRLTPSVIVLDPGEIVAADPVAAMPVKVPFLYTDGTSRFTINGTAFRGHSAFTLLVNKDLQPVYSDDVTVFDLAIGNAVITISVTLYFDATALTLFKQVVYGTAAPATNAKPLKTLGNLGSYGFDLRARDNAGVANGDTFVTTMAGVKWTPPDYPGPNPDGGVPEITLAGAMRKVAAQPDYEIDINCDAAAFVS
jgi:hypothetical protein